MRTVSEEIMNLSTLCLLFSFIAITSSSKASSPDPIPSNDAKAILCTTSNDCHPSDLILHQVPAVYINCSDNKCVCTGCFYSTNGYKSCDYKRCWQYVAGTHTCEDLRKDQRTAFLLSLFLSFAGAANFYIEQYILGGLQMAILVVTPILIGCCWLIFTALYFNTCLHYGERNHDSIMFWPLAASIVMWLLVMLMWWAADLVTFVENLRLSGNGCPMRGHL